MPSHMKHTQKWYKQHFGVDPLKLGFPYDTAPNPHFRSAAPMKLWEEEVVLPYKSLEGVRAYQKRSGAGVRAAETRKTNQKEWWKDIKTNNSRIAEITKRLWEIGNEIIELHYDKEQCRSYGENFAKERFWDWGEEHCNECAEMSSRQDELRIERGELFEELEYLSGKDKRTIQLARKYARDEYEERRKRVNQNPNVTPDEKFKILTGESPHAAAERNLPT